MPKRWELEPTTRCGEPWLEMVEDSMGDWVLYDEYEELEKEMKELRAAAEHMARCTTRDELWAYVTSDEFRAVLPRLGTED